ncbi:hypothetical protein KR51_00010580 [Rubidibacter lacunae KORDI 51-2]|uniref:Uncharacterized protein n=1 Tax=Rubidibacter lacunae KORDI 51-2 TaxID=582515 RepID=U5DCN1_9CHRO|nr:hypothetical protein KR51_00010580 [Rubidibacter lacunae KORDI 51-2]
MLLKARVRLSSDSKPVLDRHYLWLELTSTDIINMAKTKYCEDIVVRYDLQNGSPNWLSLQDGSFWKQLPNFFINRKSYPCTLLQAKNSQSL